MIFININIVNLVITVYLSELLLLLSIFMIQNILMNILIFYKDNKYKIKYMYFKKFN